MNSTLKETKIESTIIAQQQRMERRFSMMDEMMRKQSENNEIMKKEILQMQESAVEKQGLHEAEMNRVMGDINKLCKKQEENQERIRRAMQETANITEQRRAAGENNMMQVLQEMAASIKGLNGKADATTRGVDQMITRVGKLERNEAVTNSMQENISDHLRQTDMSYKMPDHLETTNDDEGGMQK